MPSSSSEPAPAVEAEANRRPSSSLRDAAIAVTIGLISLSVGIVHHLQQHQPRIFATAELKQAAERQTQLLLVIAGEVYDVSAGREFYAATSAAEGDSYAGFANGSDHTRAFLTADFEANATDDLHDLLPGQCLGIEHWLEFYRDHAKYKWVGRHHGRFFDRDGHPSAELAAFHQCVAAGQEVRRRARAAAATAPRCEQRTPSGEPRFDHGTWHMYSCTPPDRPRRANVPTKFGSQLVDAPGCVCIAPDAAAEQGWEPAPGDQAMREDPAVPQLYAGCEEAASDCTARIA